MSEVPDTTDFFAKGAPSRSASFVAGKGINAGYPCATNINSKPSGGGRVSGSGMQTATKHPKSQKGMY